MEPNDANKAQIRNWYERLAKDMATAPSYIYPEVIKVIKEMEEVLNSNDC